MANDAYRYRRATLPATARTSVGWLALCWFGLIFSPFVGFALHGKVDERGLQIGLGFALIPLAGLAAVLCRRNGRAIPPALRAQWDAGRVIPAEGAPAVAAPVRFTQGRHWIEMHADGVAFARSSLLGMQGVPRLIEASWVVEQAGQWFVPWADITEWVVEADSDGPDYCRLLLRQGQIRLRRMTPDAGSECDVLDAVRAVGHCPVRLRCDVAC